MKKLVAIIVFCMGISCMLSAQRIITNPEYEFKSTGIYTITQIEQNKENTRVKILSEFIPHWWISIDSTSYIKDVDTGKKYYPTDVEGTEFGQKTFMPDSGDSTFVLVFPPFDKNMKKFDWINGESNEGCIFGVSLKKTGKKDIPADNLYGTWKEADLQIEAEANPEIDFDTNFFKTDTAHIRGFLKGYDPRVGYNTALIYVGNEITREDYPTVVQIHPDGRFETDILLNYPLQSRIVFNRGSIPFYIEPGETLFISLDWKDFLMADRYRDRMYDYPSTQYAGRSARINRELNNFKFKNFNYKDFQKMLTTMPPAEFKQHQLTSYKEACDSLESQFVRNTVSEKGKRLLKNKALLANYTPLFDYVMSRKYYASKDSSNQVLQLPIPEDYYDFLREIDTKDKSLFASSQFSSFINRFEFMPPFSKTYNTMRSEEDKLTILKKVWKEKDSILREELHIDAGLLWEAAKVRSLEYNLSLLNRSEAQELLSEMNKDITDPFIRQEAARMYRLKFPEKETAAYKLPEGKATDIFRKYVDPHKGKYVVIDFWATTCAPCIQSIKQSRPFREKHIDSKDLAFVFITDVSSSPEEPYNKFIAENGMGDNLFRISTDDFNYLRQLFKFNGIPRYVLLDREGNVLDDNFPGYNAETEINKLLSENKK